MSAVKDRKSVLVEKDAPIGWIRLNRPERLNAFAGTMREELNAGLAMLEEAPEIRCIVITGVGRAFSTGGDMRDMAELLAANRVDEFERLVREGNAIVKRIHMMDKPVIAAVNGPAAGAGASLALACDMRIAAESASIGFTFLRVGLHPDWGATYFLTRLVGPAVAADLIFTGGMSSAERAERLGLFNRVVPSDELASTVRAMAGQIAANPAHILYRTKRMLRGAQEAELDAVLEREVQAQIEAFRSPDFREGVTAFLEKRAPDFRSR